jgi:hypothetical protein
MALKSPPRWWCRLTPPCFSVQVSADPAWPTPATWLKIHQMTEFELLAVTHDLLTSTLFPTPWPQLHPFTSLTREHQSAGHDGTAGGHGGGGRSEGAKPAAAIGNRRRVLTGISYFAPPRISYFTALELLELCPQRPRIRTSGPRRRDR